MGANTTEVSIADMHIIILRPDNDEPGILSFWSDGTKRLSVFNDDVECDAYWTHIEQTLQNENFVRYDNMIFREEQLKLLEKCYTEELGHYLRFVFHNLFEFRKQYDDKQTLDDDLNRITDILATLQDIRASKRTSPTKQ